MHYQDRKKGIIIGATIGEALCGPLEGFGPGHIRSIFGRITDYTDPSPALKGKPERWRKPGLYSSISQLLMLMLLTARKGRGIDMRSFVRELENNPPVEGHPFGAFRHPGPVERGLIERPSRGPETVPSISCARTAAIVAAASTVTKTDNSSLPGGLEEARAFTRDYHSVAAALVFGALLDALVTGPGLPPHPGLFELASASADQVARTIDKRSGQVFAAGINPETLLRAVMDFSELFTRLAPLSDHEEAVRAIYTTVNRHVASPVTRATVNHPLALPPYALVLCAMHRDSPGEALYSAASAGGSSGPLGSLCGMLAGAAAGPGWIPPGLLAGLVNRRRVLAIAEAATGGAHPGDAGEFLAGEALLTGKEIEEFTARNRHRSSTADKKRERRDPERELTRHVVESWTKIDKARYKKERRRGDGGD